MNKLLYHGKVAIVTGAGGGLGKLYAIELAKRGATVVINDLLSTIGGKPATESISTTEQVV